MNRLSHARLGLDPPRRQPPREVPFRTRCLLGIPALLLLLLFLPALAVAQSPVTELTVIYGGSSGIQPPPGFIKNPTDMNQGAGGDFIYLCYKKGIGAPITGLAVTLNNSVPQNPERWTKIDVDLNRGAGGDFIWLWYTKDPACQVIREVAVQNWAGDPPAGFTKIPVDVNTGAGGAFVYVVFVAY
jgi:hypothetical protein